MPIEILYLLIGISIGIVVLLIYKSNVVSKDIYLELERKSHDLTTQNQILQDQNNRVQFEFSQNLQKLEETRLNFTNLIAERSTLQATLENARQQFSILKSDLDEQKKTNTIQQFEITELSKKLNTIESDNRYLLEKLQTHKKEIEDFRNQSMTEFQNMANKIMEEKSIKFTQTNKDNIENLLKPLGENLDSFKKKVEETYDKESKQRFSLEDRIKELIELNNRLSNDAKNLTSALKGDAKKMGNWGEIILESILDQSGLQKNREYVIQESLKDEEGREFRPDVMVYLPEERTIVIDSKVSLVAYDRFCSS
ncbi:MAG TPA: DNA recombination protein RmuC, partial [Saprospiraceae bacterium]|nr:DNA recombination protein RmuC [Saprospiraceae bacterium]